MFVANKLDKLVSPEDMVNLKWETLLPKLRECVYNAQGYRADIATVLSTRLLNYIIKQFETKGGIKGETVCNRLLEFVNNSDDKANRIFSSDIIFNICKPLVSQYASRTSKLMMNKKVREAVLC